MATEKCVKCGAETDYGGDLHCRKIFVEKMNALLMAGELEKAMAYYTSEAFDDIWKKHYLLTKRGDLGRAMLDEAQKVRTQQRHQAFISSLGARYDGVSSVPSTNKKHRVTHCYNCKANLNNDVDIECNVCRWIICACGACGCGYHGAAGII